MSVSRREPADVEKLSAVLVTGGAGYVGSHAVLALVDAGRRVVVVDDLSTGNRDLTPAGVTFRQGDIADDALIAKLIADHDVGAIMHFAGSIVVPESVADPLKYYLNNTVKTRALLATAVRADVRRFIFSSTATLYGDPDTVPIPETAPLRPINPYGASKLMSEVMLRDVSAAHGLDYCILRYFNVAGADPAGRSGQISANGATHLIKVAAEAACGKRREISVYGDDYPTPDGTGVRDYIHVTDLATAHVLALDSLVAVPGRRHTLNCGYGSGSSVLEVLASVERVAGVKLCRKAAPRREGDPHTLVADSRLIREQLGWRPRYDDLDLIVRHALDWERRAPPSSVA
jgi:UDP-glucose 4-epimerase